MSLRFTILSLSLLFACNVFGQKIDTTYLSSDWKTSTKQLASYFRVTKMIDDGNKYEISDYYNTGELQMTGNYLSLAPQFRIGEFNWYYKNGNKKGQRLYDNNILQSEMKWNEQGKLTLKQDYPKLNFASNGKRTDADVSMDRSPRYPGGLPEVYKFVAAKFVMPTNVQYTPGKVVVRFFVDKDGSVVDATIAQSVHPLIDEEALRVVNSLAKWEQGIMNGKNVKMMMNLPIIIH